MSSATFTRAALLSAFVSALYLTWGCNTLLGIDKPREKILSALPDAGQCEGEECQSLCSTADCETAEYSTSAAAASVAALGQNTASSGSPLSPLMNSSQAAALGSAVLGEDAGPGSKPTQSMGEAETETSSTSTPDPSGSDAPSSSTSSASSADPSAVPSASASNTAECVENTYKCDGVAAVTRRVCTYGKYQTAPACADGKLCDATRTGADQCQPVPTPCIGHMPGETFCQGAKRITCSADLLTATAHDCKSNQYCAQGIAEQCAACIDGEFTCEGNALKKCNAQHTGFSVEKTCAAGECNALAGACTALACQANQRRCGGDTLYRCADDRMSFDVPVSQCGAGLCDSNDLACDVCQAGLTTCKDGGTRSVCSADGSTLSTPACPNNQPFCLGSGSCVECRGVSDCNGGSECASAACNSATNKCVTVPRAATDSCTAGQCDGQGNCVQCVNTSVCTPRNACNIATCSSNRCGNSPLGRGQTCNFDSGHYCDGAGSCVECTADQQCSSLAQDACHVAGCNGANKCVVGNAPARNSCSFSGGRLCDGSGNCVTCLKHSDCATNEYCTTGNQCAANTPFAVGHSSAGSSQSYTQNLGPDALWATRIRMPAGPDDYKLEAIGMVGNAGNNGQTRIAVYEDNGTGNAPGRYVAWAGDMASSTTVTSAANREARTLLHDAYYWVACVFANTGNSLAQYAETPSAYANVSQLYSTNLATQATFPTPDISGAGTSLGLFVRVSHKTN